jgi:selenocysteine-specific elongation factor
VARGAIEREVAAYVSRFPARFGVPKGELKSGLKTALDAALFDAAFESLVHDGALAPRAERVRPADSPWEPPPETLKALEALESELDAAGFGVPEAARWGARLGASATEVAGLGTFLGRLVRVSQEYTLTARQLDDLRARLAAHFARRPSLTVAEFKDLAGVSRKWGVPLLEHADRVGWTTRVGDERRRGPKL